LFQEVVENASRNSRDADLVIQETANHKGVAAMFTDRIITVASTAIGAAAIGFAAVGFAGTAAASYVQNPDQAFLAQISSLGISFPSPQEAVRQGHQVCVGLSAGRPPIGVALDVFHQTNLPPKQAAAFVKVAVKAYCPQFSGQPA
jgi:hypothetical protein